MPLYTYFVSSVCGEYESSVNLRPRCAPGCPDPGIPGADAAIRRGLRAIILAKCPGLQPVYRLVIFPLQFRYT